MRAKTTKYSFKWASKVVEDMLRDNVRATEFVTKISGLTSRKLAFLLATDQVKWNFSKSLIQRVHKYVTKQTVVGSEPYPYWDLVRMAIEFERKRAPESLARYLTRIHAACILEEQRMIPEGLSDFPPFGLPSCDDRRQFLLWPSKNPSSRPKTSK